MRPAQAVRRHNDHLVMPGLATAHSHAFQRALRGRTQRPSRAGHSFWSWRALMYALAERLDPDDVYAITRFAFAELAMSGVTAVGEFHYLHHDRRGVPYADRLVLAHAVIQAAIDVGVRIALVRAVYQRAGFQQKLLPAQRRFMDQDPAAALGDLDALLRHYRTQPLVRISLAAHSVRAVPIAVIAELAAYARHHGLPFHMHVAEQRREIEECLAEYGVRPVELLTAAGVPDARFVAVHATHLSEQEARALGATRAYVCLCRTTERDLGDGLPQTARLLHFGAKLCVGVDSYAGADAFEDLRAVELDERTRTETRHAVADADRLLRMGTVEGYAAIGFGDGAGQDLVYLRADEPSIAGISEDRLCDGIVFGATPRAVDVVRVAERTIVERGMHIHYPEIQHAYQRTLRKLELL